MFPSSAILLSGEMLEFQDARTVEFDITTNKNLTLLIVSSTRDAFLAAKIFDQNEELIIENAFHGKLLFPFPSNSSGSYMMSVANLDQRAISVYSILTSDKMPDDIDFILGLANQAIASLVIILIGFIVLVIGSIVWILDKKKSSKLHKK